MLTIAFDGACLADGPLLGVGRAFVSGLAAYAARGDAACVLLLPHGAADPGVRGVRVAGAPRGALRRQLALPALLRELRADVLHGSVASIPLRSPCPAIATVHDVPWLHPEAGERSTAWRRFATARALRAAAAVLAPSAMTAADAVAIAGNGGAAKVHVVPHGTDRGDAPTAATTAARSGPFLVLGGDRPRKNHARVRAAHALAAAREPGLPQVQFVGSPGAYVTEQQKVELLRTCRALVHCSLFEGFGLPVLEGLAHGAPVLCADLPPHREIAQQHAMFVEPRSVDAIAAGLAAIHRDDPARAAMASGGWAHAGAFSREGLAAGWHRVHVQVAR